jgi:uncharacterized protein (DUF2267 family)
MAELIPNPIEEARRRRSEAHRATTYGTFMNELCSVGGYSREGAEKAALCVLNLLHHRIQEGEASNLEAQLPATLRELLQAYDRPMPLKPRQVGRQEFLTLVGEELELSPQEAEVVARDVLGIVRQHVSEGEATQIERELPPDMRNLWWLPL